MFDPIFGELQYDDSCSCWCGNLTMDFFGTETSLKLMIQTSYEQVEEVRESQYAAYQRFMEQWPALQKPMAEAIIQYYYRDEYRSYGPDDEEEMKEWWPEIQTVDDLLKQIALETLLIPPDYIMQRAYDGKRVLYLLFTHKWGKDMEYDNNGIGVAFHNEELYEIGFQDIAF